MAVGGLATGGTFKAYHGSESTVYISLHGCLTVLILSRHCDIHLLLRPRHPPTPVPCLGGYVLFYASRHRS